MNIYKGQPILQYLKHKDPFKKNESLYTIGKRYRKAKKDKKAFKTQGLYLLFLVLPTQPFTE